MASLPPPTPAALQIGSNFAPIVHVFSTPELTSVLARSKLDSVSHLLSAFETGVDRVSVRSTEYETRTLPRFPVHFVERVLPPGWVDAVGGGAVMSRRSRSGTVNSASDPSPALAGAPTPMTSQQPSSMPPATPQTPFSWPNQAERDELFLDSLSSLISSRADTWISQNGREELDVRGPRPRRRVADEGDEPEPVVEVDEGWRGRSVDSLTPWYAAMRDEVLRRREMVEWETFAWPVGCLLALSTSHPDPLNALASLWDLTSKEKLFAPSSYPPRSGAEEDGRHEWADPDVLRYIVLIHDHGAGGGRDGWEDAQSLHETIRKTYGHHTAVLPIFSASNTAASPQPRARGVSALWNESSLLVSAATAHRHPLVGLGVVQEDDQAEPASPALSGVANALELGHELSDEDLKALRVFLRDMVTQSVIPWMERAVIVANERYNASKRSIGGRLFSAGRKYFGGSATNSRSGSPVSGVGATTGFNAARGYYPHAAQESQTRRLADLAFMLGDYKLSAAVYEQASRDYKNDRAWRYHSSACRMTGMAQLLLQPPSTPLGFNPDQWLELAQQTSSAPGTDLDALRAGMLYYEAYRLIPDYRFGPQGLVRAAGEADEVFAAVLLEQAALADLNLMRPSKRRFAFHMAMAAARYEKSGLKSLSRRCLSQAAALFRVDSIEQNDPLYPSPSQLTTWTAIRSHLHHGLGRQAYNVGKAGDAVQHFLELLVGRDALDDLDDETGWLDDFALAWEHLGSDAHRTVIERNIVLPVSIFSARHATIRVARDGEEAPDDTAAFRSEWAALARDLTRDTSTGGDQAKKVDVSTSHHQAFAGQTFYLDLRATNPLNVALALGGLQIGTDADPDVVVIEPPQEIELGPRETRVIHVPVTVHRLADFSFTDVRFRFHDLLPCTESLLPSETTPTAAKAHKLRVTVRSPVPLLTIALDQLPSALYAGEARSSSITVTNTGQVALKNLRGICSHPSFATFSGQTRVPTKTGSTVTVPDQLAVNAPTRLLHDGSLLPGASVSVPVLCRGDSAGQHDLLWLLGFEDDSTGEYFTSRARHGLSVTPSLEIKALVRPCDRIDMPYLLSLEIRNASLHRDVKITQITTLSPRWQCHLLPGVELSRDIPPIARQQSASILLGAVSAQEPEDTGAFSVRQIDRLLQGQDITSDSPGDVSLHLSNLVGVDTRPIDIAANGPLLSSILHTHNNLRHSVFTAQLPTVAANLHRHLFPAFSSRSLDLLVFWTIPSTGRRGHHHLTDIPLGAGSDRLQDVVEKAELKAGGLYAESQRERSALLLGLRRTELGVDQNPAHVSVEATENLTHDFEQGPCIVPVTLRIRNLSPTAAFDFTLDLVGSAPSLRADVVFVGATVHTGSVAPLAVVEITSQLWIAREGLFDLGTWQLTARREKMSWTVAGQRHGVRISGTNRHVESVTAGGVPLTTVKA